MPSSRNIPDWSRSRHQPYLPDRPVHDHEDDHGETDSFLLFELSDRIKVVDEIPGLTGNQHDRSDSSMTRTSDRFNVLRPILQPLQPPSAEEPIPGIGQFLTAHVRSLSNEFQLILIVNTFVDWHWKAAKTNNHHRTPTP